MTQNLQGLTLADLGETGLLAEVFTRLSTYDLGTHDGVLLGPGDDAAVVTAPDGRFVVTTDMLVEHVDFRQDWSTAGDIGWKAAMQNLADVAAMGAAPTAVVVGLMAPAQTRAEWAVDLISGVAQGCSAFGAAVVGGDLSGGPVVMVSITAFGDLAGCPAVTRSGASPGDVVAIAGEPGWSAAGLALLEAGTLSSDDEAVQRALARHRRPAPPVQLGPVAAQEGATAMIDTSDGLLRDLGRIARASSVSITLDVTAPVFRNGAARLAPVAQLLGADPVTWMLSGGEDHALAATFGPSCGLPDGFSQIGTAVEQTGREVITDRGDAADQQLGFDHFRL